jgi:hypothetical protein
MCGIEGARLFEADCGCFPLVTTFVSYLWLTSTFSQIQTSGKTDLGITVSPVRPFSMTRVSVKYAGSCCCFVWDSSDLLLAVRDVSWLSFH